ncbi:MAG: hypothetical protein R2799_06595 [Crocinitomicaceae bacterium]
MMKSIYVLILFFAFSAPSLAQIEIGNKNENDRKKEQKMKDDVEKEIKDKSKTKKPLAITGRNIYLGVTLGQSYRTLKPADNFFSKPINQKVDEKMIFSVRAQAGMQAILWKYFMVDFGFSYTEQGEQYTYEDENSDSSYSYINKYRYFGVPLTANAIFGGESVRFYFGGGIIPMMFINQGQNLRYTTITGTGTEELLTFRDNKYNQFNMMAIGRLGMQFNFTKHVGFYLAPEIRYMLFNTYEKQYQHEHHQWAWGVDFGFVVYL